MRTAFDDGLMVTSAFLRLRCCGVRLVNVVLIVVRVVICVLGLIVVRMVMLCTDVSSGEMSCVDSSVKIFCTISVVELVVFRLLLRGWVTCG